MPVNQSVNTASTGDPIVDQGSPSTAANAWPLKLTDGTNVTAVKAASTAPVATDPAAVVALSPNGNQATAALQTTGNSSLTSIATTSNSTAVNTSTIASNQTNGTQKVQLTDAGGSLYQVTKIDPANTTAVALGANGTFTGSAWTDVSNFSTLSVLIFTDQVSATNGLTVQYSTDGTNVDDTDQYTIPASNGQQFSFPLVGRYYRIFYTNGAVAQGAFRLQSKIHSTPLKPSSMRTGSGVGQDSDAELVLNVNGRMLLIASAPATVSAGVTSGTLIASNASRKGLVVTNTSSLGTISLNLVNGSAVLNSGITLYPHDTWYMDEWTFTTSQINVIASLAATSVAIQEMS